MSLTSTLRTEQGPTTTFCSPDRVYVFGGRGVSSRDVTRGLYVLDLTTLVWRRIEERGPWPSERYFHTFDHWDGKLVLFGGMGKAEDGSACVLGDCWVFDTTSESWTELEIEGKEGGQAGKGRYAHLSAVVGDRLMIMGGQEITNEYALFPYLSLSAIPSYLS